MLKEIIFQTIFFLIAFFTIIYLINIFQGTLYSLDITKKTNEIITVKQVGGIEIISKNNNNIYLDDKLIGYGNQFINNLDTTLHNIATNDFNLDIFIEENTFRKIYIPNKANFSLITNTLFDTFHTFNTILYYYHPVNSTYYQIYKSIDNKYVITEYSTTKSLPYINNIYPVAKKTYTITTNTDLMQSISWWCNDLSTCKFLDKSGVLTVIENQNITRHTVASVQYNKSSLSLYDVFDNIDEKAVILYNKVDKSYHSLNIDELSTFTPIVIQNNYKVFQVQNKYLLVKDDKFVKEISSITYLQHLQQSEDKTLVGKYLEQISNIYNLQTNFDVVISMGELYILLNNSEKKIIDTSVDSYTILNNEYLLYTKKINDVTYEARFTNLKNL